MTMRFLLPYLWVLAATLASGPEAQAQPAWNDVQSWVYQLTNYRDDKLDELTAARFDLAVIDLARDGEADYFTQDEITRLKESGKFVLAYFEIGAIERYRPEWKLVPADLLAGPVGGWPQEQYVRFWDERWWPIVQGRVDRALEAGFDGAYLDLITAYEEIPVEEFSAEQRAHKMVALVARIAKYARQRNPRFKIVPQNAPELFTWSYWKPAPNETYLDAIDGIGLESPFYLAHDKPADQAWCRENRDNAAAIRRAGKLVLAVDYAKTPQCMADSYQRQRACGFVPYVSVRELNAVFVFAE